MFCIEFMKSCSFLKRHNKDLIVKQKLKTPLTVLLFSFLPTLKTLHLVKVNCSIRSAVLLLFQIMSLLKEGALL